MYLAPANPISIPNFYYNKQNSPIMEQYQGGEQMNTYQNNFQGTAEQLQQNSQQYETPIVQQYQQQQQEQTAIVHKPRIKYFSRDDDAHEVYKISPKFQYRYQHQQRQLEKLSPTTTEQSPESLHHQHLAAGVSFIALMLLLLFICCLLPLVYYLCRPDLSRFKSFSLTRWIRKHLTPEGEHKKPKMPDFEKDYFQHEYSGNIQRPIPKITIPKQELQNPEEKKKTMDIYKPHKNKRPKGPQLAEEGPRRTSLHIQLKETPLEMSISEIEEETEYLSDMSDVGRKRNHADKKKKISRRKGDGRPRSKSAPTGPATTPMSPFDKIKKRFSFNNGSTNGPSNKSPITAAMKSTTIFPTSASSNNDGTAGGATITEDDEEVIYNRYSGKPIDDVTNSRSTQRIINNATPTPTSTNLNDNDSAYSTYEDTTNQRQHQKDRRRASTEDQRRNKRLAASYNRDEETNSSESSETESRNARARRNNPPVKKSSSENFYENHMVRW